jgi:hypothetical protein
MRLICFEKKKVYFDIKQGDESLGRIVIGLYGGVRFIYI